MHSSTDATHPAGPNESSSSARAQTPQSLLQFGLSSYRAGELDAAERAYLSVLRGADEVFDALHCLGLVYRRQKKWEQAVAAIKAALLIDPTSADAHSHLGMVYHDADQFDSARVCYENALRINAHHQGALVNLGNLHFHDYRIEQAIACFDAALALAPGTSETHNGYAAALYARGDHAASAQHYRRALELDPGNYGAHMALTGIALAAGDYASGFAMYERRWEAVDRLPFACKVSAPEWTGAQRLEGKRLLLYWEQGFGDTLQFLRYVPLLQQLGAHVILNIQSPLRRLAAFSFDCEICVDDGPLPKVDYQCALMSLPLAFATTVTSIPSQIPYLLASPAIQTQPVLDAAMLKIGCVWHATRTHSPVHRKYSKTRSVPIQTFERLLRLNDVLVVALQKEMTVIEQEVVDALPQVVQMGPHLADFADTAAAIAALDIIVTVDTSVAHLAGAMGKPVWILLPSNADWRWGVHPTESAWYPSAKLYRQAAYGDWASVVSAVERDLLIQAAEHRARSSCT